VELSDEQVSWVSKGSLDKGFRDGGAINPGLADTAKSGQYFLPVLVILENYSRYKLSKRNPQRDNFHKLILQIDFAIDMVSQFDTIMLHCQNK